MGNSPSHMRYSPTKKGFDPSQVQVATVVRKSAIKRQCLQGRFPCVLAISWVKTLCWSKPPVAAIPTLVIESIILVKPPMFSGWWYTHPSEKYEPVSSDDYFSQLN